MRTIRGAVAVVTGAGSGIGRALARELAGRGSDLALADVDEAGLAETAASIGGAVRVTTRKVDVASLADMTAFRDAVAADYGRASIVVNNAGVALYGRIEEVSLADLEWIMNINFWGSVYGSTLFLPMLRAEPEANLVNVSSIFGAIAPPLQTGYCAAKFAIRGFSESLRHELGNSSVRLTVVQPGGIKTNIAATSRTGEFADPEKHARDRKAFEKSLVTSPAVAASKIARAILADRSRLLIGNDATIVDLVQRFFPAQYMKVLRPILDPKRTFVPRAGRTPEKIPAAR